MIEGLSLIVGPDDGIIDNADVRVRWCVTPALTKALEEQGVENPHVILNTCDSDGNYEWRGVFPLHEVISFARFYKAGNMKVIAAIVDLSNDHKKKKELIKVFMEKETRNSYEYYLQIDGRAYGGQKKVLAMTSADVVIPDGVFGKEPPEWLKKYVNFGHGRYGADDQCEFRRRALFAFGLKWIPLAAWAILYTFFTLLMSTIGKLMGFDKIWEWKNCFHPFTDDPTDWLKSNEDAKFGDLRDSRFVAWIPWPRTNPQPVWITLLLSPGMFLILAWLSFSLSNQTGMFRLFEAHETLAWVYLILGGVIFLFDLSTAAIYAIDNYILKNDYTSYKERYVVGLVFSLIFVVVGALISVAGDIVGVIFFTIMISVLLYFANKAGNQLESYVNFKNSLWNMIDKWVYSKPEKYDVMQDLLCPHDIDNLSTDIHSIPKHNRTWALKFRDFKSKVCKPMQR